MSQYSQQNADDQELEENEEQYLDSYPRYPPYSNIPHLTHPPSRGPLAPNHPLSVTTSHRRSTQQPLYDVHAPNPPQYHGTGQQGYDTPLPPGVVPGVQKHWTNPVYETDTHPALYGDENVPTGHSLYTAGLPFRGRSLDPRLDPRRQGFRNEPYQPNSRRSTITQQSHDEITHVIQPHHHNMGSHAPRQAGGSTREFYRDQHAPFNQTIDGQALLNAPNPAQQQHDPYQHHSFQGLDRGSPQAQYFQSTHGLSSPPPGSSFAPGLSGGTDPVQVPRKSMRQQNLQNREANPPRDPSPGSPLNPPRFRIPDRPDRSESPPPGTPAGTEGSNDPQQDEDEPIASTSTSTSPTASTSTWTTSPTTVRWARFNVPEDVFINPADPVRHELYHQIRYEPWFMNQTQERPITGDEASRIPGALPGESVLLAFYDRVPDAKTNRTVMRCTICMQTNQDAHLYPRPDRARVHMRHHFELRPIPCNGKCKVRHCRQRFFTAGDLNAHVAGKTQPLVACKHCGKPLHSKNLRRHIDLFCHRISRPNQ